MGKTVVLAVMSLLLLSGATFGKEVYTGTRYTADEDFSFGLRGIIPRKHEFHTHSGGINFQYRDWFGEHWGIGLSAGYELWQTNDRSYYNGPIRGRVIGQNAVFPLGIQAVYRFTSGKPFKPLTLSGKESLIKRAFKVADWTVSAGPTYMFIHSASEVELQRGAAFRTLDIDMQSTWLLEVAGRYEGPIPFVDLETPKIRIGVGYRRDMGRTDIKIPQMGVTKTNDMTGVFGQIDLLFPF